MVPFIKTFLQTKDVDEMNKLSDERAKKDEVLSKESEELDKKLEQFKKDNPNLLNDDK